VELEMLVYVMVIWNILRLFGIFYDHLGILWSFGIFFSRFSILYEKSINPIAPSNALLFI
jgi:hypothetical protein